MKLAVRTGAIWPAAMLLLAGCASTGKEAPTVGPTPRVVQRPAPLNSTGLESVLGRTAAALQALLGKPGLDVREGPARKLQFAGPACVLDAYLYPPAAGGDPIVTHLDTRLPDGRDIDRASCVAALTRR